MQTEARDWRSAPWVGAGRPWANSTLAGGCLPSTAPDHCVRLGWGLSPPKENHSKHPAHAPRTPSGLLALGWARAAPAALEHGPHPASAPWLPYHPSFLISAFSLSLFPASSLTHWMGGKIGSRSRRPLRSDLAQRQR